MRVLLIATVGLLSFSVQAVELNNAERYEILLARANADEGGSEERQVQRLYALKWAHDCMRQYKEAEAVSDKLIARAGNRADLLFDKSCYVGKQGRFDDALKLAEEGLGKRPDDLRGKMVKAIWLAALDRKDDVAAILKGLQVPKLGEKDHNLYWLCKAYVMARLNDAGEVERAIRECMRSDADHWGYDCFQRDVTFDPFRTQQWFVDLVGKTTR